MWNKAHFPGQRTTTHWIFNYELPIVLQLKFPAFALYQQDCQREGFGGKNVESQAGVGGAAETRSALFPGTSCTCKEHR